MNAKRSVTSKYDNVSTILHHEKPISNITLKQLLDTGHVTGSTVFGGKSHNLTDIDIIIPPNNGIEIGQFDTVSYVDKAYPDSDFRSCYVKTKKGNILNLLFIKKLALYEVWVKATDKCKDLYKTADCMKEILESKDGRICIFTGLKNYYSNQGAVEYMEDDLADDEIPF